MGAERLAGLALNLETMGRDQKMGGAKEMFDWLQQEIELVVAGLRSEILSSTQ